MRWLQRFVSALLLFCGIVVNAQEATLWGVVLNDAQRPVSNVSVTAAGNGTITDSNGAYRLTIPANTNIKVEFSHISYKKVALQLDLSIGDTYEFNPVMLPDVTQIGEVVINARGDREVRGVQRITPATVRKIPGANAGVENILRSLPGVNFNNELSTQYNVRGGNFDENLVYVNGIEVYRPVLVRSGQQEGLSFINPNLVSDIDFYAGGFGARYGDRLSSVLDVQYRTPHTFMAGLEASFLGGSLWVQGIGKDKRLRALAGLRYRDNSLLVNSKQTETNFRPVFADVQTFISYQLSTAWDLSFLGNISVNRYNYTPLTRQTNFGTLQDPIALQVFYQGQEKDRYNTSFGALKATHKAAGGLELEWTASAYHTREQEYFDILAQYRLGDVNTNIGGEDLGNVVFSEGVGSQLEHGRNLLDAFIVSVAHHGKKTRGSGLLSWGVRYNYEDFRDKLQEYEVIDSAGYNIRPPLPEFSNDQPYAPYTAPLTAYQNINARNFISTHRLMGYIEYSKKWEGNSGSWFAAAGLRTNYWNNRPEEVEGSSQMVLSPRAQMAFKPNGNKDLLFRISGGLYQQPPFYRELRDLSGNLVPDVKAQKAWHISMGNDYSFRIWDRPFKLTSEAYYRHLTDVNTYTLENVRIRYRANNDAQAYAYGLDLRLNGEFVPGTDSWVSFGYLKTEENQDDRGYIARPTDQRLKFALLFQDYIPSIPNVKLYLNGVYNTGVPGGSPNYADPYDYQFRLPDYKRVDVGISYVFTDATRPYPKGHWLHKFRELSAGFEIFNIFDIRNSITNTWVRDVYSKVQYGIPNYMTRRLFNVKISMQL
ncbi:TonB-dependent receptor [Robertkochia sediminum]|uniref:TonB-dependent receptor n=1 Tax=Robertkochia sediminum TaxID=2785326 RepID=UPI001931FF64|nr:TonB-dependent receptor plug domain-containing protein [Robertkochia sediminum]MBL7472110.1 TonB-dependent receptor plug domain-containing protein [Robertkochia sediminum]